MCVYLLEKKTSQYRDNKVSTEGFSEPISQLKSMTRSCLTYHALKDKQQASNQSNRKWLVRYVLQKTDNKKDNNINNKCWTGDNLLQEQRPVQPTSWQTC